MHQNEPPNLVKVTKFYFCKKRCNLLGVSIHLLYEDVFKKQISNTKDLFRMNQNKTNPFSKLRRFQGGIT